MKLIEDIINDLIDESKPVYVTLLKTKVLATRINNKALLDWVNYELNGYPTDDLLPEYRRNIGCLIKGTYLVGYTKYIDQPIPTDRIKERFGVDITTINFSHSIAALEQMTSGAENGTLMIPFSAELTGYLEANWKTFDKEMGPYLNVVNAKRVFPSAAVKDIAFQVRHRLLEFMLEIDKQYGSLTEIKDLTNKNKEITQIMAKTIINTSGDGNIINTGNNNEIKAKINIKKSDKKQLEEFLKENGLPQEDIQELTQIIDNDNHNLPAKGFGTKTKTWIQKMIGKALDGTWQIGIGAAGELLAAAIGHYLGF
jgi:hypothetical protein